MTEKSSCDCEDRRNSTTEHLTAADGSGSDGDCADVGDQPKVANMFAQLLVGGVSGGLLETSIASPSRCEGYEGRSSRHCESVTQFSYENVEADGKGPSPLRVWSELDPSVLEGLQNPEEPTLTYAAVARRPSPPPRAYVTPPRRQSPAPQHDRRRDHQVQYACQETRAPRKTHVWRTPDRRPLCFHCGEADHTYR
ncbi:hypothetical protein HPB47_022434 [Ixodes persulcatus]|uniref:Uncharacterized protein n=1 Tax=Ixodes persulcatus TaxID=34615 RepID=A0AC60QD29_IXOPE|nr:hypothetical protein HPB47_022434 [Ixodes persulcatus]